jgi:dTDP-glucose pyrophosphorylase
MMPNWREVVVAPETPLAEAIARVDASGLQVALVLGPDDALLGILTDGNIRRAVLAGTSLQGPVAEAMNAKPMFAAETTPREEILAVMRKNVIHHMPLVNAAGRVVGLVTLDELIGSFERPNWVLLMAGGLGTRLTPLTDDCPKPMLKVGGKPILETIVESLAEQGFRKIFISVNYRGGMIRSHFGDGERWGVEVDYIHETTRLGTAGALSLLPERPALPIVVMNGDLLTRANFANMLRFHDAQGAVATMAVREYDFQVPYGVVRLDGARIVDIEEKPVQTVFVNAGIYTLSSEALEHVPADSFFDMPTLFNTLMAAGRTTAAYPLREYWLDIGRLEDFERAQGEWTVPVA